MKKLTLSLSLLLLIISAPVLAGHGGHGGRGHHGGGSHHGGWGHHGGNWNGGWGGVYIDGGYPSGNYYYSDPYNNSGYYPQYYDQDGGFSIQLGF